MAKPERRSGQRLLVSVPVSIKAADKRAISAQTRDLSMTGIFLYTDSHILEGSKLEMVLMLPPELTSGEKRWVCCQASVIRVEDGQEQGRLGVAATISNIATLPEITG